MKVTKLGELMKRTTILGLFDSADKVQIRNVAGLRESDGILEK